MMERDNVAAVEGVVWGYTHPCHLVCNFWGWNQERSFGFYCWVQLLATAEFSHVFTKVYCELFTRHYSGEIRILYHTLLW